jgi:hypothetical protein
VVAPRARRGLQRTRHSHARGWTRMCRGGHGFRRDRSTVTSRQGRARGEFRSRVRTPSQRGCQPRSTPSGPRAPVVCVCVCMCASARARARVCVCVCVCVNARADWVLEICSAVKCRAVAMTATVRDVSDLVVVNVRRESESIAKRHVLEGRAVVCPSIGLTAVVRVCRVLAPVPRALSYLGRVPPRALVVRTRTWRKLSRLFKRRERECDHAQQLSLEESCKFKVRELTPHSLQAHCLHLHCHRHCQNNIHSQSHGDVTIINSKYRNSMNIDSSTAAAAATTTTTTTTTTKLFTTTGSWAAVCVARHTIAPLQRRALDKRNGESAQVEHPHGPSRHVPELLMECECCRRQRPACHSGSVKREHHL